METCAEVHVSSMKVMVVVEKDVTSRPESRSSTARGVRQSSMEEMIDSNAESAVGVLCGGKRYSRLGISDSDDEKLPGKGIHGDGRGKSCELEDTCMESVYDSPQANSGGRSRSNSVAENVSDSSS